MKGKQKGKKNRQDKLLTVYGELHEAGKKKSASRAQIYHIN